MLQMLYYLHEKLPEIKTMEIHSADFSQITFLKRGKFFS